MMTLGAADLLEFALAAFLVFLALVSRSSRPHIRSHILRTSRSASE